MMSSGINLVMTVIGFAVSTMFIVFICTRLICARIQLHASRRSFPMGSRPDFSILERGLHGLEPVTVANFPTRKYSGEFFAGADNSQCTICLAEYHKEDILRILPSCGHYFHASCIDTWLHQHSTCPVCRISLRGISEKKCKLQLLSSSAAHYRYGEGSFATHSHHIMVSGHGFSPRPRDNRIREDERSHHLEGRDNICHFHDCYQIIEDQNNVCPVHGLDQIVVDRENFCPVHGCNQVAVDREDFCSVHGRNEIKSFQNKHQGSQSD